MTRKLTQWVSVIGLVVFLALAILLLGSLLPIPGGYHVRIVESGSMQPTIPVGAAIIIAPATEYAVGDILTFQRSNEREATTHRLVERTNKGSETVYTVRGDANNANDLRPVYPAEVLGKVWVIIPYLGYLLAAIRSPWGFLIVIVLPAAYIVYEQVQRIVSEVRKQRTDTPNLS